MVDAVSVVRLAVAPVAAPVCVSGCGSSGSFANKPRPATPVNLTVYINNARVSVSPGSVGAGQVVFIVANHAKRVKLPKVKKTTMKCLNADQAVASVRDVRRVPDGGTKAPGHEQIAEAVPVAYDVGLCLRACVEAHGAIALEEHPSPNNPLGAKGAGEGGIIPVGGVIANAVAAALRSLGVEPRDLPLSPPRVWEMIEEAKNAR